MPITPPAKRATYKNKLGRPVSNATLLTQKIRDRMVQRVFDELDPIIDAQIAVSKGWESLKIKKDGTEYLDKEIPDVNAARFLFEHSIGKVKETIEHKGAIGILQLVAQLEAHDNEES